MPIAYCLILAFFLVNPCKCCYYLPRMAKQIAWSVLVVALFGVSSSTQDSANIPATLDSTRLGTIQIVAYAAREYSETSFFAPGDSIFLFDGELYFRASAKGHDFFISRNEMLKHADSLIVYQTLRLSPTALAAGLSDSVDVKVERQRCATITKNGTRCRRMAAPGLDKCWQHRK